tara:strand:+ start:1201 stop:1587 length:387 start_codon:yes stop_codon:yes gene_type:complete
MSAMSDYLENEILDHILSVGSLTMPANIYVGLSTGSFSDDNSGTELSGSGYTRKEITFAAASSASSASNATVTFPTATGSWGAVSHWGIFDASSSGNLLVHGAFASSKTIASGDVLRINSGDLTVTAA